MTIYFRLNHDQLVNPQKPNGNKVISSDDTVLDQYHIDSDNQVACRRYEKQTS